MTVVLLLLVFVHWMVVETAGQSMHEIDLAFRKASKAPVLSSWSPSSRSDPGQSGKFKGKTEHGQEDETTALVKPVQSG